MKYSKVFFLTGVVFVSLIHAAPPKNIIFYIGDGMGFEQVEATELYAGTTMSFNDISNFPYTADCTTYSADSTVTDSAAAGTALATGVKVNNGVISMEYPGSGSELLTLLEYYQSEGKSVGLVTTTFLTHATPATFGAHEASRENYSDIAADYLTQTKPNLLFGGGSNGLTVSTTEGAGYTVAEDSAGFFAFAPDGDTLTEEYFSGQFGSSHMPYKEDYLGSTYPYPFLNEMVEKAIEILSEDSDGFFLMVEGGRIDHACHSNLIRECVHEVMDFSDAVNTGYTWAAGRTDTLILITADHETGGLTIDGTIDGDGYPVASWTSTNHSGANVPVYAWGVNADLVLGTMDNTDMFNVCIADLTPVVEPTNPFPGHMATDVDVDITLAWTTGIGAVNHVINIWTDVNPIVVDAETTEAQYSLTCDTGTTYYWTVDEYDGEMVLLCEGPEWTFTTIHMPTAATDLSPSGAVIVPVTSELSWTAGENVQEYWVYLDTVSPPAIVVSKQSGTTYEPVLTNSTTYYWLVVAKNVVGEAPSAIETFTTEDLSQPEEQYVQTENTVAGTIAGGSYLSLTASDDSYEVLTETLNVPNKNGYSTLEHVWTFELGNVVSAEFYVEAYKTQSSDGDDFVFSYSSDGVVYTDMLTVTSLEDTDVSQVYIFPEAPTGTVYIRVLDTDHTKKNQTFDSLYIDQMYIYASEGAVIKHYKASQPVPTDGSTDVPVNQILSWTSGDDAIMHEVYFGITPDDELYGPFSTSVLSFDPSSISDIQEDSVYFWRVDEVQEDSTVTEGDIWRYTTEYTGECIPSTISVDSIVLRTERTSPPLESGVATVTIIDNCGNPVEGATVTGSFTGDFAETGLTATTNTSGVAVFTSSESVKKPSFGFDVTNVVKDGLNY